MNRLHVALLGALVAGCAAAPERPLRVVTFPWPGYQTLALARSLGYFDDSQVRLVEMVNNTQASDAFRAGTVDAGTVTVDEALMLMQDGVDLRIVLVMDGSHGADVVMARPGIATLEDLRGKRVGVETAAVGAVMLDAVLTAARLEAMDITLVEVPVNAHAQAFLDGKVDAVVTYEPVRSVLLGRGAHVLFDSRSIPGRLVDVLAVRTDAIAAHPKALTALVAAHFRALDYLAQHRDDASRRIARYLSTTPGQVLPMFDLISLPGLAENRALLSGRTPQLIARTRDLGELMVRQRLLHAMVPLDHLVEPRFLPDVPR